MTDNRQPRKVNMAKNRKKTGRCNRIASSNLFGIGTEVRTPVPGITLCCMKSEYRDCLDRAMDEWEKHKQNLPKMMGGKKYVPGIYAFAYWLIRYSGIVTPAKPMPNEKS